MAQTLGLLLLSRQLPPTTTRIRSATDARAVCIQVAALSTSTGAQSSAAQKAAPTAVAVAAAA